jgi:hypothetical protein
LLYIHWWHISELRSFFDFCFGCWKQNNNHYIFTKICQYKDIVTNLQKNGDVNSIELYIYRSNKLIFKYVSHSCLHFLILLSS